MVSWMRAAFAAAIRSASVADSVGVPQVVTDRLVEQVRILGHDPDRRAQRVEGEVADVVAVDADRSGCHVVEPRQQRDRRRLAGAGRADERNGLTRRDRQRQAPEHVDVGIGFDGEAGVLLHRRDRRIRRRRIAEHDVVELDSAARIDEVDRARPFL